MRVLESVISAAAAVACGLVALGAGPIAPQTAVPAPPKPSAERHLRNIRQLTEGGENAEAYFSPDGSRLIYQSARPDYPCDQNYTMKIDGTDKHRVSTGTGRTTCG